MRLTKELKRIRLAALMGLVRCEWPVAGIIRDHYTINGVDVTWELRQLCRNGRYLKYSLVVDGRASFEPGKRAVR